MRFTVFPKARREYVVTDRKLSYARRAIQKSRDEVPLFPEFADQRTPEQRVADNARMGVLWWQGMRDDEAARWRKARAGLRALRPLQRAGLLKYWQTCGLPGSAVYLAGCVYEARTRGICFWHKLADRRRLQLVGAGKIIAPWLKKPATNGGTKITPA